MAPTPRQHHLLRQIVSRPRGGAAVTSFTDPLPNLAWWHMGLTNIVGHDNGSGVYTRRVYDYADDYDMLLRNTVAPGYPQHTNSVGADGKTNYYYYCAGAFGDLLKSTNTTFLTGSTTLTYQAWVRLITYSLNAQVLAYAGNGIYINTSTGLSLSVQSQNLACSEALPANQWTLVTATWRNSDGAANIYYDGVLKTNSANLFQGIVTQNVTLVIGPISDVGDAEMYIDNPKLRRVYTPAATILNEYLYTHPTNTLELAP